MVRVCLVPWQQNQYILPRLVQSLSPHNHFSYLFYSTCWNLHFRGMLGIQIADTPLISYYLGVTCPRICQTPASVPQRFIKTRSSYELAFVPASSSVFVASAAFTILYAYGRYPHGISQFGIRLGVLRPFCSPNITRTQSLVCASCRESVPSA
jgi:hypothetical protein